MPISEVIRNRIQKSGAVSFRDFMEMALYEPGLGYYASGNTNIGAAGDYFTSPCVSSLFGVMIARQVIEMRKFTGVEKFTLLEYGAGNGKLCYDIMTHIAEYPGLIDKFHYCIIEKNGEMPDMLFNLFPGKISSYPGIDEMPAFTGCILTNEVVDNFPVHRVAMQDELMEIFVGFQNGFTEFLIPASDALKNYLLAWNIKLPKGYYTEINLEARHWLKQLSSKLNAGYVITIDYGYTVEELYHQKRKTGSMLCYKNHEMNFMLYNNIGKQDITSHVNFTALREWGIEFGLECCGMVNQSDFLLKMGIKDYFIRKYSESENVVQIALLESRLRQLLLIEMGDRIRVLIQKKR
jgi:SAM-dependent MidA family methyltransferase